MTSKGGTFINGALVAVGLMSTNGATRIDHGNYLLYIHHKYLPGVPRIPTFSDTFDASLDSNDAPKHDFTPGSRGNIKRSGKNKTRRASGDGKNEPVQRPRLPDRPRSASRPDRREWGNTSLRSNPFYGLEKRRLSGTNFQYKSTTEDKSGTRPKADSVNTTGTAAKAGSSSGLETSEKDALQRKNENYTKDEGASETGTSSKAVVQGMIWDSLTAVLTKRTKAAVSDITGCNKESDVKNGIWTSSTASAAPVESGCSNKNEVQDSVATSSNDGNEDSSGVDSKDSMKHIRESDFKAAASDGSEKDSRKECKIDITDTDGRECTMDMADKNGGGSKADASSEREGTGGNGGSIDEQAEALAASLVDVWIAGRERNEDSALLANNLVQAMEDAISDLKAKQNGETCQKAASKAE